MLVMICRVSMKSATMNNLVVLYLIFNRVILSDFDCWLVFVIIGFTNCKHSHTHTLNGHISAPITITIAFLPPCSQSTTLTHSQYSRLRTPNIYLCSFLFIFINTKHFCSFILLCTIYLFYFFSVYCWPSFDCFVFCFAFGNSKSLCRLETIFSSSFTLRLGLYVFRAGFVYSFDVWFFNSLWNFFEMIS